MGDFQGLVEGSNGNVMENDERKMAKYIVQFHDSQISKPRL